MNYRWGIFVELALAAGLLAPAALGQKAPAPTPAPPPSSTPSHPSLPSLANPQPDQSNEDMVQFLMGRVATGDGTPVPHDVMIERVCNARVLQQVYASSHGNFSMQLGSRSDTILDASGDQSPQDAQADNSARNGISRRELTTCELRAAASGYHSSIINLVDLTAFGSSIDVGAIVVDRMTKVDGTTLNAGPYKAPHDASRAYEKGMEAARKGKFADAQKYFEQAARIYPSYTYAWFQLGTVLEKEGEKGAARAAYEKALSIDGKFLPPYLTLAAMSFEAEDWAEVVRLTDHLLELDPLNHTNVTGYIVDLDPVNYPEAYYYNAAANYKLNRMEAAERSALKAEHIDLRTRYPQLHLLLAEIFTRNKDYANAIVQIRTFLELVPDTKNAERLRAQLEKLEKLNEGASVSKRTEQK